MKVQTELPFVNTSIIPDRNAGIGSLLLDMQCFNDTEFDGPPLLEHEFVFIDVGVSRARVSTALKTLLARDLGMNVNYTATELPEMVPYANVTLSEDRAENIRRYLSGMISTKETKREVMDWHYVVNQKGKVSSVAYSYKQYGNEVWETYFMGRTFMMSGQKIDFIDPTLDEMLTHDVQNIEARIDLEMKRDSDTSKPGTTQDGYSIEKNPLEEGLAEFGISLQKTDVPRRVNDRQNVLFLGNVVNHYPHDEQAKETERIATNMQEKDIVIVQVDEEETSFIEVLRVKGHGDRKTLERLMWINTRKLEIRKTDGEQKTYRQIHLKPLLGRIVNRLINCLEMKVSSPEWNQEDKKVLIRKNINQVFGTYFRALPVEETLRIAIREALCRLPAEGGLKGIPVFKDDANDAYGCELVFNHSPIVSNEELINMKMSLTY